MEGEWGETARNIPYQRNPPQLNPSTPPSSATKTIFLANYTHFPLQNTPKILHINGVELIYIPATGASQGGATSASIPLARPGPSTFPDQTSCFGVIPYGETLHLGGVRAVGMGSLVPEQAPENPRPAKSARLLRGQWSEEEDRRLVQLVNIHGEKKWAEIAESMEGRAGKQCRERWHNHLRPHIKKDPWTAEEELILVEAHKAMGNKWVEIARCIPRRAENSVKNHWNATKRRLRSRHRIKRASQRDRPTILETYIKAFILKDAAATATPTVTSTASASASSFTSSSSGAAAATFSGSTITGNNSIKFSLGLPDFSDPVIYPSQIMHLQTRDEEMNFMKDLFSSKNDNHPAIANRQTMAENQLLIMNNMVGGWGFYPSIVQNQEECIYIIDQQEDAPSAVSVNYFADQAAAAAAARGKRKMWG